jgi:hypothetical protein
MRIYKPVSPHFPGFSRVFDLPALRGPENGENSQKNKYFSEKYITKSNSVSYS